MNKIDYELFLEFEVFFHKKSKSKKERKFYRKAMTELYFAFNGDLGAQTAVADRLATLATKNKILVGNTSCTSQLLELSYLGWSKASLYVAYGLAEGKWGFEHNLDKLSQCARKGNITAQFLCVEGAAKGVYGFKIRPPRLEEFADMGWKNARSYVVKGYSSYFYHFPQVPFKLIECAKKNWSDARERVAEGYAEGWYGFEKSHEKLEEWKRYIAKINAGEESTFEL